MLIDIGERRLFLESAGVGGPTVVLEAGAGSSSDTWDPIWCRLAEFTTVCRYDRANLGQSERTPAVRSAHDVVHELHALLGSAGIPGPYVLVGHSFGGLVVRLYAHKYPEEVAGAVLIDSSHHEQNKRGLSLLPPQAPSEDQALTALRNRYGDPDTPLHEGINFGRSLSDLSLTGRMGEIPLAVLTRAFTTTPEGRNQVRPGLPPQIAMALEHLWQEMQRELAGLSTVSTHIIAEWSGHYIHHDQPDLVVDAVGKVVQMARWDPPE